MPVLILLLVVEALVFRGMVRSPFTPWLLLAWPMGVYVAGWTLYSVWERLTSPKRRTRDAGGSGRLHVGRLVGVALVLLVLAFTVAAVTTHAAPAPPAPSYDYVPTPAGPPTTDANGQWIPEPDPPPPPAPASSSAGGGR